MISSIQSTTEGPLWTACWSPCGTLLAAAGTDHILRIYSIDAATLTPTLKAELRDAHSKTIRSVDWHQNLLAAASFDGTISIWSTHQGQYKCVAKLEGHENEVKAVRFSPDGRRIATCGRDRTVWIWSVDVDGGDAEGAEFECEAVLQEHSQDVKCLQWHPSGDILYSGSYDNTIRMFACPLDADEWLCLDTLGGHASTVWCISWHHQHLYSASDDKTIIRWADANQSSNKFNMSLKPDKRIESVHEEAILAMVVHDQFIITAGADCQICMTDRETGVVQFRHRMTSQVNQLALHAHLLAACLDSGELVILPLA